MASKSEAKRRSPSDLAASMRDLVVRGEWEPGRRLTEEALAEQWGVSRIPIREALRILEGDGFVTITRFLGTHVAQISRDEAVDLLDIRAALEPLAAGRAALRRSEADLDRLRQCIVAAEEAISASDTGPLARLTGEFHRGIAEAAGSTSLAQMIALLQSKIEWVFAVERPERIADSWIEHGLLLGAIERRDVGTATELMRAHVTGAHVAYRRFFDEEAGVEEASIGEGSV